VLDKVFAKDKVENYRKSFQEAVERELDSMMIKTDIGSKVREQVGTAFNALKAKIESETERILGDTQKQLTNLSVEFTKGKTASEKEQQGLEEMLQDVNAICLRTGEIGTKLSKILNREAGLDEQPEPDLVH
jgi:hypothetical protein